MIIIFKNLRYGLNFLTNSEVYQQPVYSLLFLLHHYNNQLDYYKYILNIFNIKLTIMSHFYFDN